MSKRTREVWHCDVCGWEWLPDTDKVPERCPNRECRKRNWNLIIPQEREEWMKELAVAPPYYNPKLTVKHSINCACYQCKPPKPPKSSS